MDWTNLNILVTGGTGSFGKKFTELMLKECHPKKLVIFSRGKSIICSGTSAWLSDCTKAAG